MYHIDVHVDIHHILLMSHSIHLPLYLFSKWHNHDVNIYQEHSNTIIHKWLEHFTLTHVIFYGEYVCPNILECQLESYELGAYDLKSLYEVKGIKNVFKMLMNAICLREMQERHGKAPSRS